MRFRVLSQQWLCQQSVDMATVEIIIVDMGAVAARISPGNCSITIPEYRVVKQKWSEEYVGVKTYLYFI